MVEVKDRSKTFWQDSFWQTPEEARQGWLQTVDEAEAEFRRWLNRTGGMDAIPHEVSTRASRVPRASGVAARLAGVSRFARINPWINALGLALDLFELYRSMGKDIPEHIQYSNGGIPGSGDVWCGPVQKWVQPRQIWSPGQCGSEQSFKVSQWDNGPFGPVVQLNGSGKVTQLRWRGYQYTRTAVGLRHALRHAWINENFSNPVDDRPLADWDEPLYVPASVSAPIFINPAQAPIIDTLDPFGAPIGQPTGTPSPVPWDVRPHRRPNPFRVLTEQRQAGYGLRRPVKTPVDTKPLAAPRIELELGSKPKLEIGGSGGWPPEYRNFHRLAPPPKRNKEGKVKSTAAASFYNVVHPVISNVGEVVEFIQAIYDALPDQFKVKYPGTNYTLRAATPQQKVKAIYENFHRIDLAKAIRNFADNQLEDAIWGLVGQTNADASAQALTGMGHIGIQSHTSAIPRPIKF